MSCRKKRYMFYWFWHGVSISTLTGDKNILRKSKGVKAATRGIQVKEYIDVISLKNMKTEYSGENKKTRTEVIAELQEQGKLKEDEVKLL